MEIRQRTYPVLYIPRLREEDEQHAPGLTLEALERLLDHLVDAEVETPAVTHWMVSGPPPSSLEKPCLLATSEDRPRQLAQWSHRLARRGLHSILFVTSEAFSDEGPLSMDAVPLLTGHGVALASRGTHDEPLVGQSLGALRESLKTSRERLTSLAGYPIRMLAPRTTLTGRALDGLVSREAQRTGYDLLFRPSRMVRGEVDEARGGAKLTYTTCYTSDDPDTLAQWVTGSASQRAWFQMRRFAKTPRRLWSRLTHSSDGG